jgi:predicted ATP-dependent serine protease
MGELDRVLGGGLVPGSAVLVGGDPGIGKSTLLLQAFAAVSQKNITCLYVTGEESQRQIKMRAERKNGKWVLNGNKIFITHARYADFSKGVIDTGHVVFFILSTGVFLFLTVKVLESRRWK